MPKSFGIKIVGPAGSGIFSAGEIVFRSLVKSGYYCQGYPEYPSLIKGGHNTYLISLAEHVMPNNAPQIDILIALTANALEAEKANLTPQTRVIADATFKPTFSHEKMFLPALLDAARAAGNPLTLNTGFIGFLTGLLKLNPALVFDLVKKDFAGKSDELIKQNQQVFEAGLALSKSASLDLKLPKAENKHHRLVLNGSQAIGLGAIAAGINLYAGYPMTPSSPVLHYLASKQSEFGFLVRQAEDEIAAINMAIGASFAGAKTMTGTSGGGFALMQEAISLAGMIETPLVIYLAMRPGPATGLPTWTSQSDLDFAINAGHGEFPRIVLAPGDPRECYLLTHHAFVLSQKYHLPVIILSDKYLSENLYCLEDLPEIFPAQLSFGLPTTAQKSATMYPRYQYTTTGVSTRSIPGVPGGEYLANSDEHQDEGLVDESETTRTLQNTRRLNRLMSVAHEIPMPELMEQGTDLIITWGSNRYIGREIASSSGQSHMHFSHVWPIPSGVATHLRRFRRRIVVENNTTNQFAKLLFRETGVHIDIVYGHDSGRPIDPAEVIKKLQT